MNANTNDTILVVILVRYPVNYNICGLNLAVFDGSDNSIQYHQISNKNFRVTPKRMN